MTLLFLGVQSIIEKKPTKTWSSCPVSCSSVCISSCGICSEEINICWWVWNINMRKSHIVYKVFLLIEMRRELLYLPSNGWDDHSSSLSFSGEELQVVEYWTSFSSEKSSSFASTDALWPDCNQSIMKHYLHGTFRNKSYALKKVLYK